MLEERRLRHLGVAARLLRPLQRVLRQDLSWETNEVPGTEVAEIPHQEAHGPQPRSGVLLRHRIADNQRAGGKQLIDTPGYLDQTLVTSLPPSERPIAVWREYNGRAGCEKVSKPLDADFALRHLCLKGFWAIEAALSWAIVGHNLCTLFQRKLGGRAG